METRVDEIAAGVYRLSTLAPDIAPPSGFTFNQFLIDADEPMLFHTGMRPLFPLVRAAVEKVMDPARLRWISFSHLEGDECGALNEWLAIAPQAAPAHGELGCMLWLNDLADRPPRVLADNDVLDLGGKRMRFLASPHVPHNVDAGVVFEETTATLFCSDILTHVGDGPARTDADIFDAAVATDMEFPFTPTTRQTAPALRRLAALSPRTLAIMHGSAYDGDAPGLLERLARLYDERLRAAAD